MLVKNGWCSADAAMMAVLRGAEQHFLGGREGGVKTVNAALMKQGYEQVLLKVLLNLAVNISASLPL